MGKADYWHPGAHNKICDRTGFKIKSYDAVKEWNNLVVRKESYEPRQAQDLIRSRQDRQQVQDPRTEQADRFVQQDVFIAQESGALIQTEDKSAYIIKEYDILTVPAVKPEDL